MKKFYTFLVLALMAMPLAAVPAFAGHGKDCKDGRCSLHEKKGCCKSGCDKSSEQCPLAAKFMEKAHFFLDNQQEIGLSEEQVKTIKQLKMERKKAFIRQKAEYEVFGIDLKMKLYESPLDVDGINGMIDQFSASMANGSKETVAALAELKSVLDDTQMAKAKEIWKKKK